MECLANSSLVVRVVSGDDEGYLYFHGGQVVHAMSSNAVGESAFFEILGWNRGSFEPCSAGWPSTFTITKPWQGLLMSAATARDEAQRKVVDFPRERSQGASMLQKPPKPSPVATQPSTHRSPITTPVPTSSQRGTASGTHGIGRAVRLEADGHVLSTRGDADELTAMTAYALRLSALIGDDLGMGDLRAVECVTNGTRRLFYLEPDRKLIGLEAPIEIDLAPLREKLGL
jgi:hypothetical protein